MRLGIKTGLASLLPVLATCAGERIDPPSNGGGTRIAGPLYTRANLRNRELAGVHLGMTLEDARRALTGRGLIQRHDNHPAVIDTAGNSSEADDAFFAADWRESVGLYYIKLDDRPAEVVGVHYTRHLSATEDREIEARRSEILRDFGAPSYWRRAVIDGRIDDEIGFVPAAWMRGEETRSRIQTCHTRWWRDEIDGTDCSRLAACAREPVMEISFGWRHVNYYLRDFARMYESLSRDPEVAREAGRPLRCFELSDL